VVLLPDFMARTVDQLTRRHGASHKGQKLNAWSEANMLEAIKKFHQQNGNEPSERLGVRTLARAWNVP